MCGVCAFFWNTTGKQVIGRGGEGWTPRQVNRLGGEGRGGMGWTPRQVNRLTISITLLSMYCLVVMGGGTLTVECVFCYRVALFT